MQPNILFIMTDQQRYDCVGAHGNSCIRTPHLDALVGESADLRNAFVQAPVCVPSRQSIFTGRYPHCHRNRVNYTPLNDPGPLMQAYLRQQGYATGCVGKLHYFPPTREHAESTGFDRVLLHDAAHTDEHSDYVKWLRSEAPDYVDSYRDVERLDAGNPFRTRLPEAFHETTWCGEQTRGMLHSFARENRPFFLFSSYWKPHAPFELPDPWASLYDDVEMPLPEPLHHEQVDRYPLPVQKMIRRVLADAQPPDTETLQWITRSYYGAVSQIDHEVGMTLDVLRELGLEENTIVLFCSDHGEDLFEHGFLGKNLFFDSSVHVPMMIRFPGVVCCGPVDDLLEGTDLFATLLDLCRLEIPGSCQGRSFAHRIADIEGGSPYVPREYVVSENIIPEVITGLSLGVDHEYRPGQGVNGIIHPDAKMIRSRQWKLNYYVGHGMELYDLENDPRELDNRADDPGCAGIVRALKDALLDWMITCDESEQIAPRWGDV